MSQIQFALTPDSMEMLCADFESRSLSIRDLGNIYAADVGFNNLRKYARVP